jgi:hypothetical protein
LRGGIRSSCRSCVSSTGSSKGMTIQALQALVGIACETLVWLLQCGLSREVKWHLRSFHDDRETHGIIDIP